MSLSTTEPFGKAVLITLVLTVLGYLLFTVLGTDAQLKRAILLSLATGTLLGALLNTLKYTRRIRTRDDSADEIVSVFIGNLPFKATQREIQDLFSPFGEVHSVRIMTDRATRRPRGFGFVEMPSSGSKKAIKGLDGIEMHGRKLRVNEGSERRDKDRGEAA